MANKTTMTPKQVVRRYLRAITHGTAADLAKWAARDIQATQGSQKARGMAALEAYAMTYRKRVAGWKIEPSRIIAERNWVAVAGAATGKLDGAPLRMPFLAQYRVARGKVAEVVIAADSSVEVKSLPASRVFPLEAK